MTLYTGTVILTELMMLAMVLHVQRYPGFTGRQKRWFLLTFFTVMLCAGTECLAIDLNSHGAAYAIPLTISNVIQFSLSPLLPVFFAGALGETRLAERAGWIMSLHVLIEIICAPKGLIFYYDAAGTYFHGPYYFIYEAFYVISAVFLIAALIIVGRRFEKRDIATVIMILVVIAASILPLMIFHIYTNYIGIGISACLCYIYYNDLVQQDVRAELVAHQEKISNIQRHVISELANLIESRDVDTGEHVARTSDYIGRLARLAREDGVYADVIDDEYIEMLQELAPLHDIGKITVSDTILCKPGRLTAEEFKEMQKHTTAGGTIVRGILEGIADEEELRFAQDIAMYHHEWWNGNGYPEKLSGEAIPLPARLMAVVDVYDALTAERCYKAAMPPEKAFAIIEEESGTHFDPKLAKVFLDHRSEFA